MEKMTKEECLAFLGTGTRTGKLATVREDGRPHVVPIWFVLDGDRLIFNTWHSSVKALNMQRDQRVAVCVDEMEPPYQFVSIEGRVTMSTDLAQIKNWATQIGGRYMGADRAEEFGERNGVEGELLVTLTVDKWIGRKNVAGE
ncbi:MAG: PPOX class F420-dependent oxidoreductase [Chloroflexi bacterium]|nr:PPOX class F420-dependent oxidoreductase [Chloroflexota bacterium]